MGHRHKDSRAKWTTTDDAEPHPADVLTADQVSKLILLAAGGGGTTPAPPNPPPPTPPAITPTGITASIITTSGVTISWTTTDASTGYVEYGTTSAYGSQTASTSSGTSGSQTLTALMSNTLYHYRVVTASGSTVVLSSDRTFTTQQTAPPPPPPPATGLMFGTLDGTPGQAGNYIPNALSIAGLQTGWDRHESSAGVWSAPDGATYASDFEAFKSAGLKVSLEMGINYPPTFYQSSTYKYIDQFGNVASGRVIDWIWRAAARDKVEAYVRRLNTYVAFSDTTITDIRISTDEVSELLFPQHTQGGTVGSYWAYSGPAQSGTGLATGTVGGVARHAVVVPSGWAGWKPGDALPGGKPDVSEWYGWYLDSLVEATTWMTALLRSLGYAGRVWAVMPGQGAKPTQQAAAYTARLASGTSSDTMAVGAAFHLVYPRLAASGSGIGGWCSSAAENVLMTDITQAGDASLSSENEGWSSHRRHAYLAARNGMARAVENPGGGTSGYGLTMCDYLVRQARACGASVCSWAHETNLVNGTGGSNGGAMSFAGYAAKIRGAVAPVVSGVAISGVTTTGVTISWTTDKASTGVVQYGNTTAYGQTTSATSSGTTHSRTLTSLVPNTLYHLRIVATDTDGNVRQDTDRTFTTASVGGTIYGSAIETDSRDNRNIGGLAHDTVGMRFRTDGGAITHVAFDRRTGSGYSAGTGGTIKIALQAAKADGSPSDVDLASSTFAASNPGTAAIFDRVAVSGTVPAGLAFVILSNVSADPVGNYIGANNLCVLEAHPDPIQPLGDDCKIWVKNDRHGWREYTNDTGDGVPPPSPYKNTPCFDVTYADGHHAGIRYEGVRNAGSYYGSIDGTKAIRQTITPTVTRSVSSAAMRVKRLSGTAALTIELLNSGGSVLASGTFPAASIPTSPDLRALDGSETFQQRENALAGGRWAAITFGAVTLTAGQLYYLRATTSGGTVYMAVPMHRTDSSDTGGSTWGSWCFTDGRAQRFESSWADLPAVADWQFWLR